MRGRPDTAVAGRVKPRREVNNWARGRAGSARLKWLRIDSFLSLGLSRIGVFEQGNAQGLLADLSDIGLGHAKTVAVRRYVLRFREWIRAAAVAGSVAVDVAMIGAAAATGAVVRFGSLEAGNPVELLAIIVPVYLLASLACGAHQLDALKSGAQSLTKAAFSLLISAAILSAAAFVFKAGALMSRIETIVLFASAAAYLSVGRVFGSQLIKALKDAIDPTTLVLTDDGAPAGAGPSKTVIDVRAREWRPHVNDPGFLNEVFTAIRNCDRIVLSFAETDERRSWAELMRLMGVHAEIVEPELAKSLPLGIGIWGEYPTLIVARGPLTFAERITKRAFDLAVIIALAPVVIPVIAALAVMIKLESPGPAFFLQERVGRNNRRYLCYKMRTMRADRLDSSGHRSASRADDRVTKIGRLLRSTSLDELPQLWNVFLGEMSLVGPRPHALGSTAEGLFFWDAVQDYWSRHSVKPGLTGLAQIRGLRGATQSREEIELRVASDLEYINSWSVWLDFRILIKTIMVIVHRNAY